MWKGGGWGVESGGCLVDGGRWTMDDGQWTVDGRWAQLDGGVYPALSTAWVIPISVFMITESLSSLQSMRFLRHKVRHHNPATGACVQKMQVGSWIGLMTLRRRLPYDAEPSCVSCKCKRLEVHLGGSMTYTLECYAQASRLVY